LCFSRPPVLLDFLSNGASFLFLLVVLSRHGQLSFLAKRLFLYLVRSPFSSAREKPPSPAEPGAAVVLVWFLPCQAGPCLSLLSILLSTNSCLVFSRLSFVAPRALLFCAPVSRWPRFLWTTLHLFTPRRALDSSTVFPCLTMTSILSFLGTSVSIPFFFFPSFVYGGFFPILRFLFFFLRAGF